MPPALAAKLMAGDGSSSSSSSSEDVGSQIGRRGGMGGHHAAAGVAAASSGAEAGASIWDMTPGKAILLWLGLVGIFLALLPRLCRSKRVRVNERSD
jgi:hypothetical protein